MCADATGLEEEFCSNQEMSSLRGHSPNAEGAAGNRDYAHVLFSPRVGGPNSPSHPMSRRSLSQKRMQEPSLSLLKPFKGQRPPEIGEDSPRDSNSRTENDGDSVKVHGKERGHLSRFGDKAGSQLSRVKSYLNMRNWRQTAFFAAVLLIFSFMLLKILLLGFYSVQNQSLDASKVISLN